MAKSKAVPQPGMSRKSTPGGETSDGSTPAMTDEDIVLTLEGYRQEAEQARMTGFNPRDDKWKENWNAYWNRYDFTAKADWQAKETLAEVPSYVDRFAAAMKEALVSAPEGFYTVKDPADTERDMVSSIKKMEDVWLSRCGRSQSGDPLAFGTVFEEQMKLGCVAACNAVVLWKEDVPDGRVAVETLDPQNTWLDHTFRGLYRVRSIEIDKHEVARMAAQRDSAGQPIYNLPEVAKLVATIVDLEQRRAQDRSGTGQDISSKREPVILHEYYADIIGNDGKLAFERALAVVANNKYLVRRPEANPFWHGRDWVLFAPLVPVPLSPYGRSYMEDFGSIAKTFNELTNMILDAVHTAALKAFVVVPAMLRDPGQLAGGISPNKVFYLEEGFKAEDFLKEVALGGVNPDAINIWKALKTELSETAKMNDIGLGQFAPNSRTSATEVQNTQQNSTAMIRSVADTVENTFLNPLLEMVWKTGLQHCSPNDKLLQDAAGPAMFKALLGQKRELAGRRLTFQAQGISRLIERAATLRSLIQLMQVVAGNPQLLAEFLKVVDIQRLVELLFELSNIDIHRLQSSERQRMLAGPAQQIQQAGQDAAAATAGQPVPTGMPEKAQAIKTLMQGIASMAPKPAPGA